MDRPKHPSPSRSPPKPRRVLELNPSIMRSNAHQEGSRPDGGRSVTPSRFRSTISTLPRQETSFRESRRAARASLTGAEPTFQRPSSRQSQASGSVRPGSRESSKENMAPPDADEYEKYRKEIEALKAEIGTLQYRMQTTEQEKEIALSLQSNRVEQARRQAQDEVQRREAAESARSDATSEVEAARREAEALKDAVEKEKAAARRRAREAEDQASSLREELQDLSDAKEEAARAAQKKLLDLNTRIPTLERSLSELGQEIEARDVTLQERHEQLTRRDETIANLEADVLRLKAQSGDAETMQIIKSELTEQVSHIRALEATNRNQLSELKHLRAVNRAVEVVEEEKRVLQRRAEAADSLEAELAEARIQRQRLEDERLSWTSYLKNASGDGVEFDSPEAIARALAEERLNTASYADKLGAVQAELAAQQDSVRSFEEENQRLQGQVEEAKASAGAATADKAHLRIERQRVMAVKEVEFLRAQLRAFDTEDQTMHEEFDEARATRIGELEKLVDEYRAEVQALHKSLASLEQPGMEPAAAPATPVAGTKRPRSGDAADDDQLGQLARKNRKLQEEATGYVTKVAILEKDIEAFQEQLAAAKQQNKTRILSLRSNPTSDHEAIKRATLEALKKENEDLLATLQSRAGDTSIPVIPTSVLAAMEREIAATKAETASAHKTSRRLKEVWGAKSQEFKEAIFSTLGWTVTFIPNGKMRVESTFMPSQTDEHENSIVFDGERGTMKVGGGPKSVFARRISDQIGFWVREKGCIPGFLAALTLEFYEEHTRASSK